MRKQSKKTTLMIPLEVSKAIAGLQWEVDLLRSTLRHAADLLGRATFVRPYKRGDVWKLAQVSRTARIFIPKKAP